MLMEHYVAAAKRVVEPMLPAVSATEDLRRAREVVFVGTPRDGVTGDEAADGVFRRFLERAYRRPPAEDVRHALDQYRAARDAGQTFTDAVTVVLQLVLISPRFLLRILAANSRIRRAFESVRGRPSRTVGLRRVRSARTRALSGASQLVERTDGFVRQRQPTRKARRR